MAVTVFQRLDEGVRRWMVDHDWTDFTPIQHEAIPTILDGTGALLIAPTATGKTEAALLPIVSEIQRLKLPPLSLLYIAPLRALVNDQTRRAQLLLEECGLRVRWWHGDLPASERKKLMAYVPDALFTTPESVEVILSSDSYGHGNLLGDVRYVVIDEIHAFTADDRGNQMLSLLARIEQQKNTPIVRVGLSATVNNPETIARWMASGRNDAPAIPIIIDPKPRERKLAVGYLGAGDRKGEDADERSTARAVKLIARHAERDRTIVFVNSRRDAETITIGLRESGVAAFVHHGSIDREERQRVEASFRSDERAVIVATSTLELGIDIGDMGLVVQIGPPFTALSLLQRVGRSGRRAGKQSRGVVYAAFQSDIPSCLAAADLATEGVVEDLYPQTAAIQVLFHQIIQLIRECDRIDDAELISILSAAGSFRNISQTQWADVLEEMLEMQYVERERGWLRVGPQTEREFSAMNYRDFYAVFEADTEWTVRTVSQVIGSIDRRYPIARDKETLLVLAGRAWRVIQVDEKRLTLVVEPAKAAPIPKWMNTGLGPSYDIMRRMYEMLCGRRSLLETEALEAKMVAARQQAADDGWKIGMIPTSADARGAQLHTFYGSQLNIYLALMLRASEGAIGSSATPEMVLVSGLSVDAARKELLSLMRSPELRRERLEQAVELIYDFRVGRFWHSLGPKSRRNALIEFYRVFEPAVERAVLETLS